MTNTESARLSLTAHPLQRMGAYAVMAIAKPDEPDTAPRELSDADIGRAVDQMCRDATTAALVRESKNPSGFWLKASYSLFPGSAMNHPSNAKRTDDEIRQRVQTWRTPPDPAVWPDVSCILCGAPAVGYFGKLDVALAESYAYRNTTPRGHEGMALCWPCLVSFHALPYGCQLTGGSSVAVHSWDERFLRETVFRQVDRNARLLETGNVSLHSTEPREATAFRALRTYDGRLTAGVDLLVFNNNNRGQLLEVQSLDQPIAEWLRRTLRHPERRNGFVNLVRAHATTSSSGVVNLARNAFRAPHRIVTRGADRLARMVVAPVPDPDAIGDLAALLFSFATEVMTMNEKDLAEIRATARNIASLLADEKSPGKLRQFRSQLHQVSKCRAWLTRESLTWVTTGMADRQVPFVNERAFVLLFDPGRDNPAPFHRDLLLVGVLEELSRQEWRPSVDADSDVEPAELDEFDRQYIEAETANDEDEVAQ